MLAGVVISTSQILSVADPKTGLLYIIKLAIQYSKHGLISQYFNHIISNLLLRVVSGRSSALLQSLDVDVFDGHGVCRRGRRRLKNVIGARDCL